MPGITRMIKVSVLLLLLWAGAATAQDWGSHVVITSDDSGHGNAQAVLDDAWRLHVFYIRRIVRPGSVSSTLAYRRFDSWGNSLSEPVDIGFDSCNHIDGSAGVLLDRNQNIHVVWSRSRRWPCANEEMMLYSRLDTAGSILTEPIRLTDPGINYFVYDGISMVQDCTGIIWVSASTGYWAFSEVGEVLIPTTHIVEPPWYAEVSILDRDPQDRIWALIRNISLGGQPQNISVVRIDTVGSEFEIISPNDSLHEIFGMGPLGFQIDSIGVFHSILWRDDAGLFYQRNPRDGQPSDTLLIDPFAYSSGQMQLSWIGADTLLLLWGNSMEPTPGFDLDGFHLNGSWAWGPEHVTHQGFGFSNLAPILWRAGSCWVVGGSVVNGQGQLAMIHIPGPEEPPNAVGNLPRQQPQPIMSITVYPQPVSDAFSFRVDPLLAGRRDVRLYNLLGQQIAAFTPSEQAGIVRYVMPTGLSAGMYFLIVQTPTRTLRTTFLYVP